MPVSAEGRVKHQKLKQTTAEPLEKSVLAYAEKRVDFIPTFLAT